MLSPDMQLHVRAFCPTHDHGRDRQALIALTANSLDPHGMKPAPIIDYIIQERIADYFA